MARYPTVFGKYLLLERINVGGMAEVFKAKTFGVHGYERILALKRILPNIMEDEDFIRMFIDEARIASHLEHSNVVRILELGQHRESLYIAMEFVQGRDLRQLMNLCRKKGVEIPQSIAAYIISEAAKGLDYAHRRTDLVGTALNIIHRDVSPQNILLSWEGDVKVCDFGIAKAKNRAHQTQAGVLKGKFAYMSPEQVRGKEVDHRSDIFGLGTIAHEMVSGRRLFLGESDFSTLERVRKAQAPRLDLEREDIDREFSDMILGALSRDPAKRYNWASDFGEALQPWLIQDRRITSGRDLAEFLNRIFPNELDADRQRMQEYLAMEAPSGMTETPAAEVHVEGSYDDLAKEVLEEAADSEKTVIFDPGSVQQLDSINTDQERTILHNPDSSLASLPPPAPAGPVPLTEPGDDDKTVLATLEELQAAGLVTGESAVLPSAEPEGFTPPPPPPPSPVVTSKPPPPPPPGAAAATVSPPVPPPPGPATASGRAIPVIAPPKGGERSNGMVLAAGFGGAVLVVGGAIFLMQVMNGGDGPSGTQAQPVSAAKAVAAKPPVLADAGPTKQADAGAAVQKPAKAADSPAGAETKKVAAAAATAAAPAKQRRKSNTASAAQKENRKPKPKPKEVEPAAASDCVLTVLTTPQGARVKMDSADLGPSPVSQTGLDCARSYTLKVSHPDYVSRTAPFSFGANKKKRMSLSLQPKPKPKPKRRVAKREPAGGTGVVTGEGTKVQIGTPGVRTQVNIDGKNYGMTPLAGSRAPRLSPGRHRLVLTGNGQTWKYSITVPRDAGDRVSLVIKTLGEPVRGKIRAIPE